MFVVGVSPLVIIALLAITFPSIVPAWLLVGVFELRGWVPLLVTAVLAWPAWYALIRFTEGRLDVTCPVSLLRWGSVRDAHQGRRCGAPLVLLELSI